MTTSDQVNISHLINDLHDYRSLETIRQESSQMTRVEQLKMKFKGKKNVSFKQPMLQRETIIQGHEGGLDDISGIVMASDTNSSTNTGFGAKSLVINLP